MLAVLRWDRRSQIDLIYIFRGLQLYDDVGIGLTLQLVSQIGNPDNRKVGVWPKTHLPGYKKEKDKVSIHLYRLRCRLR